MKRFSTFWCMLNHFSLVWLCATVWTVAHQAPLSMGFPGKNTGVGCHALLQGIFLTQGLNLRLLHCRLIFYCWATWKTPMVNKEIKTKLQWATSWHLLWWLYQQQQQKISVGKDIEKWEHLYILWKSKIAVGTTTVKNNLVIPQKVKHKITIWSRNPTPRYLSKRTEKQVFKWKCVHQCL